jgi:hypothetical protein
MPILASDIVFLESQVMDDVPEGGGAATRNIIEDGRMNNVFEDIYDLDRTYGRLNMRKVFLGVRSLTTDTFGGVKTAITELPEDEAISYVLFSTDDQFDTRAAASDRLESYLAKGPVWHGYLYDSAAIGSMSINLLQRPGTELPPIGKTLCLSMGEDTPGELFQYIRVQDVAATTATFTDEKGDYERLMVTLSLEQPLAYGFPGHPASRFDTTNYTLGARVRTTSVADAARYYGTQRAVQSANVGDLTVRAKSMFAQLVPASQVEQSLINQNMTPEAAPMVATAGPLSLSIASAKISPNGRFVAPMGLMPGSLSVTIGGQTVTDDGQGNALIGGTVKGQVVYATGEVLFDATAPTASGTAALSFIPATEATQQAHTRALAVTPENRRRNWVELLSPLPQPGSLSVSFMAQGNWYSLLDNGQGSLQGTNLEAGSGDLSYVTGVVALVLGALPDDGSQILLSWASPAHYAQRAGFVDIDPMTTIRIDLGESIEPGTVDLTWTSSGTARHAVAGAGGIITGDASGTVKHQTGEILMEVYKLPDPGTSIRVQASKQASEMSIKTGVTAPGGMATISVGEAIEPGSLRVVWTTNATTKTDSALIHFNYSWTNGVRIGK